MCEFEIFIIRKGGVEQADSLTFVLVDARIGEAGVLVTAELVDGIVHEAVVEDAQSGKQLEVFDVQAGDLLEQAWLQLRDNVLQGLLAVIS